MSTPYCIVFALASISLTILTTTGMASDGMWGSGDILNSLLLHTELKTTVYSYDVAYAKWYRYLHYFHDGHITVDII